MNKILKTLFLSLVFLSALPVFAGTLSCHVSTSCTGSEIKILEMQNSNNAHAGLPASGYSYSVCCSGVNGLGNSCSGNNQIVAKLSNSHGSINAHVRQGDVADDINYPSTNHACISVPANGTISIGYQANNCSGYDTTLFSMAKTLTNSHIGVESAYINKVCASAFVPGSVPILGNPPSSAPIITTPPPVVIENTTIEQIQPDRNIIERILGVNKNNNTATTEINDNFNNINNPDNTVLNEVKPTSEISAENNSINQTSDNENTENRGLFSAASIFGTSFLPETPLGWAVTALLIFMIVFLVRKLVINRSRLS